MPASPRNVNAMTGSRGSNTLARRSVADGVPCRRWAGSRQRGRAAIARSRRRSLRARACREPSRELQLARSARAARDSAASSSIDARDIGDAWSRRLDLSAGSRCESTGSVAVNVADAGRARQRSTPTERQRDSHETYGTNATSLRPAVFELISQASAPVRRKRGAAAGASVADCATTTLHAFNTRP